MTRKHYIAIAAIIESAVKRAAIHDSLPPERQGTRDELVRDIALDLADELGNENPRFTRSRFLTACGFPNE